MQQIRANEGDVFAIAGTQVCVAYSRGGRLIAYVTSEIGETNDDLRKTAAELKTRLDRKKDVRKNKGKTSDKTRGRADHGEKP